MTDWGRLGAGLLAGYAQGEKERIGLGVDAAKEARATAERSNTLTFEHVLQSSLEQWRQDAQIALEDKRFGNEKELAGINHQNRIGLLEAEQGYKTTEYVDKETGAPIIIKAGEKPPDNAVSKEVWEKTFEVRNRKPTEGTEDLFVNKAGDRKYFKRGDQIPTGEGWRRVDEVQDRGMSEKDTQDLAIKYANAGGGADDPVVFNQRYDDFMRSGGKPTAGGGLKDGEERVAKDGKTYRFNAKSGKWQVLAGSEPPPKSAEQTDAEFEASRAWNAKQQGLADSGAPGGYGNRADGAEKGEGYFGELKRPGGSVSTELSIGVKIAGKETEIPLLVPTLTKPEVDHLLAGKEPTDEMVRKAVDYAEKRIAEGRSPFAGKGERYPAGGPPTGDTLLERAGRGLAPGAERFRQTVTDPRLKQLPGLMSGY